MTHPSGGPNGELMGYLIEIGYHYLTNDYLMVDYR